MPYESGNNNMRVNANTMEVGTTMYGTISDRQDVDCFKINFPYAGTVRFHLTLPSNTNYRIRIFDAIGDEAVCVGENTSDVIVTEKNVNVTVVTNKTYCVVISPQPDGHCNPNGSYSLSTYYTNNALVSVFLDEHTDKNGKYWNDTQNTGSFSATNWKTTTAACPAAACKLLQFGKAYQCKGFALFIAYILFGREILLSEVNAAAHGSKIGDWTVYRNNISSLTLRPGDIIGNDAHFAVVWKVSGNTVYVVECLGSLGCEINFGYFNGHSSNATMSAIKNQITLVMRPPIMTSL